MTGQVSMRRMIRLETVLAILCAISCQAQTAKPKLTLDEFFNSVSFDCTEPGWSEHVLLQRRLAMEN
jgi:hypothetical protein